MENFPGTRTETIAALSNDDVLYRPERPERPELTFCHYERSKNGVILSKGAC
jgi:hypothetical protein